MGSEPGAASPCGCDGKGYGPFPHHKDMVSTGRCPARVVRDTGAPSRRITSSKASVHSGKRASFPQKSRGARAGRFTGQTHTHAHTQNRLRDWIYADACAGIP